MTRRSCVSLAGLLTLAVVVSPALADSTVTVLEFGPGGSVHKSTSQDYESTPSAVVSFWNVLHKPESKASIPAGMPLVPDLFTKADAGIVIGLSGLAVQRMNTAASLMDGSNNNDVIGQIHLPGQTAGKVLKQASLENTSKENVGLMSSMERAVSNDASGMEALSFVVDNIKSATEVDNQLKRMFSILKERSVTSQKTVLVHVVMEGPVRRRLEGENNSADQNNQSSNEKTMYEIQTFNLYLWTSVGLVVLVFMVLSTFVDMPLFPDTLLHGEAAKIAD